MDEIWNIANTIARGVQTVKTIKQQQKRISNVKFDKPVISKFTVSISNITIMVEEPDEYALIFSANGVYTDIFGNEMKLIIEDDIPTIKRVFDLVQTFLMAGFFFFVMIFSKCNKMIVIIS